MGCCGSDDSGSAQARQMETQRAGRIQQGMGNINETFSGFDPAFYQARQKAFVDYATPKLGEEAQRTQNDLLYSLANKGLLHSSVAEQQQSAFGRANDQALRQIQDTGLGQAQALQRDVEGQRGNLIAQLQASGDPSSVGQQAIASAQQFSAPSPFSVVGPLLNDFANIYLAQQIAKQPTGAGGQQPYNSYAAPVGASYSRKN
jgi:hypothetical protein